MTRPVRRRALLAALLLAAGALPMEAQATSAGRGNAGVTVTVGFVVRSRLDLRRTVEAEVVEQRGDTVTLTLGVEVAANQAWTLAMISGAPNVAAAADLRVRDHDGVGRPLRPGAPPVVIVEDHGPCNYTPFTVDLRLVGVRNLPSLRDLTFELSPSVR